MPERVFIKKYSIVKSGITMQCKQAAVGVFNPQKTRNKRHS